MQQKIVKLQHIGALSTVLAVNKVETFFANLWGNTKQFKLKVSFNLLPQTMVRALSIAFRGSRWFQLL